MGVLLSGQLLVAALVLAAVYALVAMGLNLVYGTMRLLNVAHGEIVMLGGYVAFWAFTLLAIPPPVSMLAAMAGTAALGALVYCLLFRRLLRTRHLAARIEANSLLVFFGASVIIQNTVALLFSANERAYAWLGDIVIIGNVRLAANKLLVLAVAALACLGCAAFFRLTRAGLAMRALMQQRDAAALAGIDVERINLQAFALGFALAGLAGALISMTEQVSPFFGFPFTISAFVIIILGGLGNLWGGIVGALILAVVEVYGGAAVGASFRSILV
jgi:branched-chain amino acid transport system permease protein